MSRAARAARAAAALSHALERGPTGQPPTGATLNFANATPRRCRPSSGTRRVSIGSRIVQRLPRTAPHLIFWLPAGSFKLSYAVSTRSQCGHDRAPQLLDDEAGGGRTWGSRSTSSPPSRSATWRAGSRGRPDRSHPVDVTIPSPEAPIRNPARRIAEVRTLVLAAGSTGSEVMR